MIRREKEPLKGEWSIPGGAVEVDEGTREAAVREFTEECGGEIALRDLVDVGDIVTRDEEGRVKYRYVLIDFWAEWIGGELQASDDVMHAAWVRVSELDGYGLPEMTRGVIEKAVKMRARTEDERRKTKDEEQETEDE